MTSPCAQHCVIRNRDGRYWVHGKGWSTTDSSRASTFDLTDPHDSMEVTRLHGERILFSSGDPK